MKSKRSGTSAVRIIIISTVLVFAVILVLLFLPAYSFFHGCSTAQGKAQVAADSAKDQLGQLKLITGKSTEATAEVYGDCIDSDSYNGHSVAKFVTTANPEDISRDVCQNVCPEGFISDNNWDAEGGGNTAITGVSINYHNTAGDTLNIRYSLRKPYDCPQNDAVFRACDKSDLPNALLQPALGVLVTYTPAHSEFKH